MSALLLYLVDWIFSAILSRKHNPISNARLLAPSNISTSQPPTPALMRIHRHPQVPHLLLCFCESTSLFGATALSAPTWASSSTYGAFAILCKESTAFSSCAEVSSGGAMGPVLTQWRTKREFRRSVELVAFACSSNVGEVTARGDVPHMEPNALYCHILHDMHEAVARIVTVWSEGYTSRY